jgi:hypothetical protein
MGTDANILFSELWRTPAGFDDMLALSTTRRRTVAAR